MLAKWFQKSLAAAPAPAAAAARPAARMSPATADKPPRGLDELDHQLLCSFLGTADCVMPLSASEADLAARAMSARQFEDGEVLVCEGDTAHLNFMLWILEGEATIETLTDSPKDPLTITVLEPGSTVGEMGLMDGLPRSATCTASCAMRCAVLTRDGLRKLAVQHPEVAVKLMAIVCLRIAVRMRDVTEKFRRYVVMTNAMRDELLAVPHSRPQSLG